jgi:hypothetical protein
VSSTCVEAKILTLGLARRCLESGVRTTPSKSHSGVLHESLQFDGIWMVRIEGYQCVASNQFRFDSKNNVVLVI